MTQLDTNPPTVDVGLNEVFPAVVDMSAQIESGDVLSSPVGRLYDTTNGGYSSVSLTDSAYLQGTTQVVQIVRGAELAKGHRYRLEVTASFQTSKVLTSFIIINCP